MVVLKTHVKHQNRRSNAYGEEGYRIERLGRHHIEVIESEYSDELREYEEGWKAEEGEDREVRRDGDNDDDDERRRRSYYSRKGIPTSSITKPTGLN